MKAVLVDDEELVRQYLKSLLLKQNVTIVAEAEDAEAGFDAIVEFKPDVVFLDIQMPGKSGMQLASAINELTLPPLTVFVTGYSEHAVTAFERSACDYLLKPVSPERLHKTLQRVQKLLETRPVPEIRPLQRLPVRADYAIRLVDLAQILYCFARDKKVFAMTMDGTEHRTFATLTELEQRLPSDQFFRVHDSYLVALTKVEELLFLGNHDYELRLHGGARVPIGRTRYPRLRENLGL